MAKIGLIFPRWLVSARRLASVPRFRFRRQRRSRERSSQRASARIAVLVGIAGVFVASLLLNLAMETVRPDLLDPEFGHRVRLAHRLQRQYPQRPLYVALGSSRTEMGLSPTAAGFGADAQGPVLLNLGQSGCGPVQEWMNWHRLLREGLQPAHLLVEVLPPVLFSDEPAEAYLKVPQFAWGDLAVIRPYCDDFDAVRRQWLLGRIYPWHTRRVSLLSAMVPSWLPWPLRQDHLWKTDAFGWMPYPRDQVGQEERSRSLARAEFEYRLRLAYWQLSERPCCAYRALLEDCRQRGIPVTLYLMPEGPTFRTWYPPRVVEAVHAYLQQLANAYSVRVIDARTWIDDDSAYPDSHHLLPSAARRFSERFGQAIRENLPSFGHRISSNW